MSTEQAAATPLPDEIAPAEAILADGRLPNAEGGVKAIAELAQKAVRPGVLIVPLGEQYGLPPEIPLLVDARPGQGDALKSLRPLIEQYRTMPRDRTGVAKVTTLQAFIDLANRHKDGDSAVFADACWPKPSLTCVVDYHTREHAARNGRHRILYEFPVTDEFTAWIKYNGEPMKQAAFAAFLEDHAAELAAPYDAEASEYQRLFKERVATPAELIKLSRDLEIFEGARVKRQERLSSGERVLEFNVEHTTSDGGKVDIPGVFMISLPPFIDGDVVRLPARLRYRLVAGDIVWFYQLYRPERELRERVRQDMATVAKETELPVYEGAPEA